MKSQTLTIIQIISLFKPAKLKVDTTYICNMFSLFSCGQKKLNNSILYFLNLHWPILTTPKTISLICNCLPGLDLTRLFPMLTRQKHL